MTTSPRFPCHLSVGGILSARQRDRLQPDFRLRGMDHGITKYYVTGHGITDHEPWHHGAEHHRVRRRRSVIRLVGTKSIDEVDKWLAHLLFVRMAWLGEQRSFKYTQHFLPVALQRPPFSMRIRESPKNCSSSSHHRLYIHNIVVPQDCHTPCHRYRTRTQAVAKFHQHLYPTKFHQGQYLRGS